MKKEIYDLVIENFVEVIDSLKTVKGKTEEDNQKIKINMNKLKILGALVHAEKIKEKTL